MSPELILFEQRLHQHALEQPQAIALWGDAERLDYEHLWRRLQACRQQLRDQAIRVLALMLDNGIEAMLWDLAALLEQVPCLPLAPFFTPTQVAHCLVACQADRVIAAPCHVQTLSDAGYRLDSDGWHRAFGAKGILHVGTAKITFTSGTTGTPKGVCLSADSLLRVARELYQASAPLNPLHHIAMLPLAVLLENLGSYAALYAGATLSLPGQASLGMLGASGVQSDRLLGCLTQRQPHSLILVPQLLQWLVSVCELGLLPPHWLRFVAVGGARVSPELLKRCERLGLQVFEGYGLSECASVVSLNVPGAHRPGSVGKPLPHVQVRLAVDGEIEVAGAGLLGYLGEPAVNQTWLATGDLGELDSAGFLTIRGRKKHQFITSYGRNVNPEWVEAELTQSGVVGQAFVYGEAMPVNVALLWPAIPACTDEQLAQAVTQANARLPDYARITRWARLPHPMTLANGLLTANGRPRREALLTLHRALLTTLATAEELPS